MINRKKIIVVLPAFNAERTLEQTYRDIPHDVVDEILLVDDGSADNTISLARRLNIQTIRHERNYGYGRNQKTCYSEALKRNADIIIMVHPDYQYTPKLVMAMASMIAFDVYDVVLGSRIIGSRPLKGGMPVYKFVANRFLTAFENIILGSKLSEFHTGYRAFSKEVLESLPLNENSDDFIFDNEMLVQVIYFGYRIGEISCPTKYFDGASSISFGRACRYGVGVVITSLKCLFHRLKLRKDRLFDLKDCLLSRRGGNNEEE
ncbi:MAG: glycosyltransferase family 2 protein [Deltaproteobacteria bacterium]|nr:glycosyltransferase family 2 protein [Deltaproteobacteria bacterium]